MRTPRILLASLSFGLIALASTACGVIEEATAPPPAAVNVLDSTEMTKLAMQEPGRTLKSLGYEAVTAYKEDDNNTGLIYTWNCDTKLTSDECGKIRHTLVTNDYPNIYLDHTGAMKMLEGSHIAHTRFWNAYMEVPEQLNRIDKLTAEQRKALFGALSEATKVADSIPTGREYDEVRYVSFAVPTVNDPDVTIINYEAMVNIRPGV